ncbi:MAG: phosphatidylserine decarboxylase [Puniceicoccales bacterium]|jgi:phosphatidylserine decarboxylase|nr:phosphatidylserine decarboxylase [Puniceicoccales bacterium]
MRQLLFFNRYTGAAEEEEIWGRTWLRFSYGTAVGRMAVAPLIRRKIFSFLLGKFASSGNSRGMIAPFVEKYGLKKDSFEKKLDEFTSFNDFFTRKLNPFARPIAPNADSVSSPVDGRHLAYDDMRDLAPFFVKGECISPMDLALSGEIAKKFENGSLLISRLCPTDYHRFHFPVACVPEKTFLINGEYASIHPIAMGGRIGTFLRNKRMTTLLHAESCGDILMVEIGATGVGTIKQTFSPEKPSLKCEEKGYFEFGGSTVILMFEKGRVKFSDDIVENTGRGMETYILMGDEVATILPK